MSWRHFTRCFQGTASVSIISAQKQVKHSFSAPRASRMCVASSDTHRLPLRFSHSKCAWLVYLHPAAAVQVEGTYPESTQPHQGGPSAEPPPSHVLLCSSWMCDWRTGCRGGGGGGASFIPAKVAQWRAGLSLSLFLCLSLSLSVSLSVSLCLFLSLSLF